VRLKRVNHVGVLINDLEPALRGFRDLLGLPLLRTEIYGDALEIAFLPCGDTQVELIRPRGDSGEAAEWIAKHGPGIQHVAFEVDDLEVCLKFLRGRGVNTMGEAPRRGAGDTIIAFLDPEPFGGILVELAQPCVEQMEE
jgi:methylmalonyl-CoA/ethylmalonyl-CoA epimerase